MNYDYQAMAWWRGKAQSRILWHGVCCKGQDSQMSTDERNEISNAESITRRVRPMTYRRRFRAIVCAQDDGQSGLGSRQHRHHLLQQLRRISHA